MTAKKNAAQADGQGLNLQKGGEGWRPEVDDEVRGILRSIDKGWSDWTGSYYPILTIEQDGGKLVSVHCFHSVLLNRVLQLKPREGEYVGCKFFGSEKTNDGKRTVQLYAFDVVRAEARDSDPYAGIEQAHESSAEREGEPAAA